MRDKPSEWIAISDLMSGVMAVVLLLLVISVLQNTYAEIKHQQEKMQSVSAQKEQLTHMLDSLVDSFIESGADEIISVDINAGRITLKNSVFDQGSACVTANAIVALKVVEQKVTDFLHNFGEGKIVIEGHTDNSPVARPVIDFKKYCTVYDDNYTLSAARAREARKLVIGELTEQEAKQVIVAGYGDSQPIEGLNPADGANRRVEITFTLKESLK